MFTKGFNQYAMDGDTITCTVDGFDCTAMILHDYSSDRPDYIDTGFWPSLDPKDAGYLGEGKDRLDLSEATERATEIMDAWECEQWWYVGVAVTVSKDGIQLTGKYDHPVWGIECNYPGSDNSYLMEVANEELSEALQAAKDAVARLTKG